MLRMHKYITRIHTHDLNHVCACASMLLDKKRILAAKSQLKCRKTAYLGNGIVMSGIVNNSGLGDGRLCCHRVV